MGNENIEIIPVKSPAAGTWHRDCELIRFNFAKGNVVLEVRKDSNDTKWEVSFPVSAFKWYTEENPAREDLKLKGPVKGGFFEVKNSPWVAEHDNVESKFPNSPKMRHFIYYCYDDIFEFMADSFEVYPLESGN